MFCCTLLYVHSSFAIILMGKRERERERESWLLCLVCLPGVSWFVVLLFLAVPWVGLQFVIVVFPDHTYLLFFGINSFAYKEAKEFLTLTLLH